MTKAPTTPRVFLSVHHTPSGWAPLYPSLMAMEPKGLTEAGSQDTGKEPRLEHCIHKDFFFGLIH